jgi:N-acetylglucosamine kinase-like BadF-type ATPase
VTASRTDGPRPDGLVLAVDGGNSKTDLALLDTGGGLRSLVRGGGCNAHIVGVDGCVEVLERLLATAIADAGVAELGRPLTAAAQILLAGADLPEERATLQSRIEQESSN